MSHALLEMNFPDPIWDSVTLHHELLANYRRSNEWCNAIILKKIFKILQNVR